MVAQIKRPTTLLQAMRHFDADTAYEYIKSIKYPDGACCPKCGSVNVGEIRTRRRFQCREKGCRTQFSLLTGTIFESSHLKLDQWCAALWMIVNCKNGVSSCEIARAIGCKQQSAWHLLHRARELLQPVEGDQFHGECESDETFVGGLMKWMSTSRQAKAWASGLPKGKSVVHAIYERRTGTVRAEVIPAASAENVRDAIMENVAENSILYTDSSRIYDWANDVYRHQSVNHNERYVDGRCHTNSLECYFNTLRRGLKGTYIRASHEHLTAYVNEQTFRFNFRKETDWERFDRAMRMIVGKRLTYKELTDGCIR